MILMNICHVLLRLVEVVTGSSRSIVYGRKPSLSSPLITLNRYSYNTINADIFLKQVNNSHVPFVEKSTPRLLTSVKFVFIKRFHLLIAPKCQSGLS